MRKILFILTLTILIFSSCNTDLDYEIHGYTQKIIVEGWIENGKFPSVYVSLNVPVWKVVDSATILENVIRVAKVTVWEEQGDSEILTSQWDTTYFPPYVYRGTELKGKEGKTYYMKVEYGGYTVNAKTTIPYVKNVTSFETTPVEDEDSMRVLSMTFDINPAVKNGYRVYSKKQKDGFFTETPVVFNSEFSLSGTQTFNINPQPQETDPSFEESGYFKIGDVVQVKLCTLDSISTLFFKDLTFFSSSTGVGNAYFVGEKNALKSNISSPGFGIWYGNATKTYTVIID